MRRYVDPLWKKKSAPTRDQGLSGNSVPFIGSTLSRRYFSQTTQFLMSLDSPGHHTDELAFFAGLRDTLVTIMEMT